MLFANSVITDAFFCGFANHLSDGIRIVDSARSTLFWNKAAENLTGYTAAEMLNLPCYQQPLRHKLTDGTTACRDHCPLSAALAGGLEQEQTLILNHRDGHLLPIRSRVLPLRSPFGEINGAIEIFTPDYKVEQEEKLQLLSNLAFKDPVTQLVNRQYAELKIKQLLLEMQTTRLPFTLMLIRMTNLTAVNQQFGPALGDKSLLLIGRSLSKIVGPQEIVGRWQSASFLALLNNTRKGFLLLYANKVKALLENLSVPAGTEPPIPLRISVAATVAAESDSLDSLLRRAENAITRSELEPSGIFLDLVE